jgi:hypothetical protein
MPKPEKFDRQNHLLEKVKHILATIEEKLNEAERERQIIALLKSIEALLQRLGMTDEQREAEIVALLESSFRPSIDKLKAVDD